MSTARKAVASVKFNGKNVSTSISGYVESIEYTDVASGGSDTLDLNLHNIGNKWLSSWYPTKGDKVSGSITFMDWNKDGKDLKLSCGTFTMDDISFRGGPRSAKFSAVSAPANENFSSLARTKTWKKVTIQKIASEIASRYGMQLSYSGGNVSISSIEQSKKTDSEFLYELVKNYGLSMKVYKSKLVIYDQTAMEKKNAVATLTPASFIGDSWDFLDTLAGTYTGAKISYKSGKDNKETSVYHGLVKESAKNARTLRINETVDSKEEAYRKAAAQVNAANESATTLTGPIWPNPKICAGACVTVSGFGKPNGKYFVDKVVTSVSDSGTVMTVTMHKCQTRLPYKAASTKAAATKTKKKKSYKVGDIVQFKGGKHYVSSYPGAKGYNVSAGPAKITIANGSGKAHPWHLVTTNWSKTHVWGWVDEGTFE